MNTINGNVAGVRNSLLERMLGIYDLRMEPEQFASEELIELLAQFTDELRREVSVYISRDGRVRDVSIGDAATVKMSEMRLVRNENRLCGIRCIHTHPNGNGLLSTVDIGTLKSMKLDCMSALGVLEGRPTNISAAFIGEKKNEDFEILLKGPLRTTEIPQEQWLREIFESDARLFSLTVQTVKAEKERAVLVGIETGNERYDTLAELSELAKTAGAQVLRIEKQKRNKPDSVYYVGKGKAEELALIASELEVDLFVFDDELSSSQIRNLEEMLGSRVLDRAALILDIFATRAQSREGKLQVELAQLKYRLPRLIGFGQTLSRIGGGIGTRGPGEKKLETDRRRIRRQVFELETELQEIAKQRSVRRVRREKNAVPLVAIVGYTNAGKSTLLNLLSRSDVLAEDMLFATLDPVTRSVTLPGGTEILLSDTVGFINKLPHDLVEAFTSTLEEATNADVILHVIDASSSYFREQMRVVDQVLDSLGAGGKPTILVYNKMDTVEHDFTPPEADSVCISAKNKDGIDKLLALLLYKVEAGQHRTFLTIPYSRGEVLSLLRQRGRILSEEYLGEGTLVEVMADSTTFGMANKLLEQDK